MNKDGNISFRYRGFYNLISLHINPVNPVKKQLYQPGSCWTVMYWDDPMPNSR